VVPPLYGLDIETDTAVGGLDPTVARVVAVAVSDGRSDVVFDGAEEATLLRAVDEHLAALPAGVVVTWNGAAFDLPFLAHRSALLGVDLGLELRLDPTQRVRDPLPGLAGAHRARWHDHDHLDGYRLYRADVGRTLGLSCGLKAMARLVAMEPVAVDVANLHLLSTEEVAAYVASDARLARELVLRRLPHALRAVDGLEPAAHRRTPVPH